MVPRRASPRWPAIKGIVIPGPARTGIPGFFRLGRPGARRGWDRAASPDLAHRLDGTGAVAGLERVGMDPYLAVERQKHHEAPVAAATTTSAPGAGAVERMRHKLNSAAGKALSAARKRIGRPGYPPGIPRSRTPIADHRRPSMARVKSPAARPRAAPAAISRHSAAQLRHASVQRRKRSPGNRSHSAAQCSQARQEAEARRGSSSRSARQRTQESKSSRDECSHVAKRGWAPQRSSQRRHATARARQAGGGGTPVPGREAGDRQPPLPTGIRPHRRGVAPLTARRRPGRRHHQGAAFFSSGPLNLTLRQVLPCRRRTS